MGRIGHMSVGSALDPRRSKFKIVLEDQSKGTIPEATSHALVAMLAALRAYVQLNVAVDRGHKHSTSRKSEICIWTYAVPQVCSHTQVTPVSHRGMGDNQDNDSSGDFVPLGGLGVAGVSAPAFGGALALPASSAEGDDSIASHSFVVGQVQQAEIVEVSSETVESVFKSVRAEYSTLKSILVQEGCTFSTLCVEAKQKMLNILAQKVIGAFKDPALCYSGDDLEVVGPRLAQRTFDYFLECEAGTLSCVSSSSAQHPLTSCSSSSSSNLVGMSKRGMAIEGAGRRKKKKR